ncbi:MAG: hypothetical protein HOE62_14440 [Alphaproteobacteria bacterium]|jgi:hypothetical protein|nr:hypothetical protein [Alphaproteobacteria bacterium]MBT4019148.1 hypothetical protein [Alphaproteobacteria bacterium]MBT5159006.1 hypothetical protein [Alphaproteobacteria bacterium]MBT7747635.1 hypothetical protein [Alphaproteobacteria bacterium]
MQQTKADETVVDVFDGFGRCIPQNLVASAHVETRRYFHCNQPAIDYDAIYVRIAKNLGGSDQLGPEDFSQRCLGILERIRSTPEHANLLNAVHMPFFLPSAESGDIGTDLENKYLPGLEKSFKEMFPENDFTNHTSASITGNLSVAPKGRHGNVLEKLSGEVVVGIYFLSLAEYSVPAAREQVEKLDPDFSLAGGFDTCAAMIGSPDLLLRKDGYPPLLWFAGLEGEEPDVNYHIEAYGHDLTFNRRFHLGNAAEYWANGLVITG